MCSFLDRRCCLGWTASGRRGHKIVQGLLMKYIGSILFHLNETILLGVSFGKSLFFRSTVLKPNLNKQQKDQICCSLERRATLTFTCVSVRLNDEENSARSAMVKYCLSRNFFSKASSCDVVNGVRGFRFCLCLRNEQIFALIFGSSLFRALSMMFASGNQARRVVMLLLPLVDDGGEYCEVSLLVESISERILKSVGRLRFFKEDSIVRRGAMKEKTIQFVSFSSLCLSAMSRRRRRRWKDTIGLSIELRRRKSLIGRRSNEERKKKKWLISSTIDRSAGRQRKGNSKLIPETDVWIFRGYCLSFSLLPS